MTTVRLLPITPDLPALLDGDGAAFEGRFGATLGGSADAVREVAVMTIAFLGRVPRGEPWGCFLAAEEETGAVVGTCGFKSAPTADGRIEIAYGTFPPFEGRGVATAMATALVGLAEAGGVRTLIAHTLPERNASGRVLTKAGFRFVAAVEDPEDGPVWRWERPLRP